MKYLWVAMIGMACQEQQFHSIKDSNNGATPKIDVDPLSLNFGILAADDDPEVRTFTISSIGSVDLTVEAIEFSGEAGSFSFLTPFVPMTLAPGDSHEVQIVYEPIAGGQQIAQAIVSSDDDESANIPVNLIGESTVAELDISPNPLNFGVTYVGCNKDNLITLTNVGTADLIIDGIDESTLDTSFSFLDTLSLPLTLAPSESTTVSMAFNPETDQQVSSSFNVTSNEPLGTREANQVGQGAYVATYEQIWTNPVDPPSDIIFAVDQSCSMDDDSAALGNNFGTFINELSNYSNDWQIMVTNDDNGCTNSGILTPSVPNYQSTFSSAVQSMSNTWGGGMYTEALLTIASQAVENTDQGECNTGFLRNEALLHIVLVSDEPEQSSGNWQNYVDQIIAKKGNIDNVRISAIAGDYPSGCSSSGNSADFGSGYYEAVNMTGGIFMSICSNWSSPSNLQLLAEASVIINSYPLDNPAVESTIQVFINGAEVTGTWSYDSGTNSVIFASDPPEEGDTVRIVYSTAANCD